MSEHNKIVLIVERDQRITDRYLVSGVQEDQAHRKLINFLKSGDISTENSLEHDVVKISTKIEGIPHTQHIATQHILEKEMAEVLVPVEKSVEIEIINKNAEAMLKALVEIAKETNFQPAIDIVKKIQDEIELVKEGFSEILDKKSTSMKIAKPN